MQLVRAKVCIAVGVLAVSGIALLGCTAGADSQANIGLGRPNAVLALASNLQAPAPLGLPTLVDRRAGIALRSCADLIDALRSSKDLGEVPELPRFNEYVDCLTVTLLAEGRGARDSSFDLHRAGETIYRDLDLASVRSSLAPRRPAEHYRLRDFKQASVEIGRLSVSLHLDGFSYEFKVLALGDFQHLGQTELLIRFTDRATQGGSYNRSSLLVVDVSPQSPAVVAVDAMDVLRARVGGLKTSPKP
jgi:hypothetical protein